MGLQDFWGPLLAWDLFLGGAGAAAYLVGIAGAWAGGRYRPIAKIGIYAGPPLVAIGALLLMLDLGQPTRFWLALLRPTYSIMSFGAVVITLFLVLGFIHMALSFFGKLSASGERWLGTITAVLGLGVMLYTGLLLGLTKAVPFWNTPVLPLLFLVSALATGLGVVILLLNVVGWLRPGWVKPDEAGESVQGLVPSITVLTIAELFILGAMLALMNGSRIEAAVSAQYLLAGGYAVAFWVGVVVIGIIAPLALLVWKAAQHSQVSVSVGLLVAICLLIGGVILRYAILAAGFSTASTL